MKKNLTFLFAVLLSMVSIKSFAHDIAVANSDGKTIYYIYTNNNTELAVSYRGSDSYNYSNEYSGDVAIPETVTYNGITYSVTSIVYEAFRNCPSLTSITIPNSVTSIGGGAFENCTGLTSVNIPNSVTSIGGDAFYHCSSLTSITIPNSVTSIGGRAFWGCLSLTSVTIPNSVTSIGYEAFEGTAWYNNQPDGLVYAGKVAYTYKGDMPENTKIILNDGTLGISESAFRNCSSLTSVTIPNSVTSIGNEAFFGCTSLTSITIPNSVTSIGSSAFRGCSSLTSINIPNSVTSIDGAMFSGCTSLTSVTIPNSVTSIGNRAFDGCSSLTSVNIPNSVTSIGICAFEDCSSLTSVGLSNNLAKIESNTFEDCIGLTSITIPQSVNSIENCAFKNCTSLTEITSLNPNPPAINAFGSYDPFDGVDHTIPLYVPKGRVLKYNAADGWRNFVVIREISDEDNDIYLTINDGAHGNVKLRIDKENPYMTMKLEAESGWHVHNVTLNGDNVTAEVASDGTYTTPAINSNSLLSVVYAQGSTSAPSLEVSNLYLHTAGNTLYINGTKGDEQVSVLTLDGKCVVSQQATSGLTEIVLDGHQTYIVKVGQETFKLLMK